MLGRILQRLRRDAALTLLLAAMPGIAAPVSAANEPGPDDALAATLRTARETVADKLPELDDPAQRADAWGGLGMLYHAQDLLAQAAEAYRRALDEAPALHWHYLLGVVLVDQGDLNGGVAQFRHALELADGGHMLASYRLGMAFLTLGDHRAAAAALREALAQAPESAAVLTSLGDAETASGNLEPPASVWNRPSSNPPPAA